MRRIVTVVVFCSVGMSFDCATRDLQAENTRHYRQFLDLEFSRLKQSRNQVVLKNEYLLNVTPNSSENLSTLGFCNVGTEWTLFNSQGIEIHWTLELDLIHQFQDGKWKLISGKYRVRSDEFYKQNNELYFMLINEGSLNRGSGEFQNFDQLKNNFD